MIDGYDLCCYFYSEGAVSAYMEQPTSTLWEHFIPPKGYQAMKVGFKGYDLIELGLTPDFHLVSMQTVTVNGERGITVTFSKEPLMHLEVGLTFYKKDVVVGNKTCILVEHSILHLFLGNPDKVTVRARLKDKDGTKGEWKEYTLDMED